MQGRSDRSPAAQPPPVNRLPRPTAHEVARHVGRATVVLAASLLVAALSPAARADEVITNGGFETGTFAGWNAGIRPDRSGGGLPYLFNNPSGWLASNQTQTDGTLSLAPVSGFSAFSGFEGSPAGLQLFLNQQFSFNSTVHNAPLSFTFDIVGGPQNSGAIGRKFEVVILSATGHERIKLFQYMITGADSNPLQKITLDIRSALNTIGPGGYVLEFRETIPEASTGPALFVLDNVSLDIQQNCGPKPTCPPDQTIECVGPTTTVHLHGSADDLERDPLTFVWTEGNTVLGTGADLTVHLTPGKHTITLMVSDNFGGMGMCTFMVTIVDTKPPRITCPANITTEADDEECTATLTLPPATALDDCDGVIIPVCVRSDNKALTAPFPAGTTTITCTATDKSGHTATCSFTVTVTGGGTGEIVCPANITVSNTPGQCGRVVTYPAPTVDVCGPVTVTCNPPSGFLFPVGMTMVTCTAKNAAGAIVATCTFKVTVTDNEKPTITCPNNITVMQDTGVCGAVVTYNTPMATDNCPGLMVSCSPPSGTLFPVGMTTVTCTATDASGNTTSCSFKVTVTGIGPLNLVCNPVFKSVSEQLKGGNITFDITVTPGATLVCTDETGRVVHSGDFFGIPPGLRSFVHTVTCVATDGCGNTKTCTFQIHLFC